MKQTELPLHPKRSPIYNKISQVLIAIIIIVVVLRLWNISNQKNISAIDTHFAEVSEQHLGNIEHSIALLLTHNLPIQPYLAQVSKQPWLESVHWYGVTGELLVKSEPGHTINALYGLDADTTNQSQQYVPFIKALHTDKLAGYLRITVNKDSIVKPLLKGQQAHMSLLGLCFLLTGVVGFLLTRGFNRFSRQGFRIGKA